MLSFIFIDSQIHFALMKILYLRGLTCTCYFLHYCVWPHSIFSCFMFERFGQENKNSTFIENKNNVFSLENKEGFLVLMIILLRQYSSIDVNFQFENIFVNFKLSFMLCIHYIQYKVSYTQKLLKMLKVVANI